MSVELDPAELGFRRPFTHEVAEVLRLHNPNSDPVAFKVKTTAPKQYCVRPNSGRIEVGGTVEVQVLLQAMKEDPPLEAKCRDKFLVQSVAITADKDANNVAAIWSNIEGAAKSAINEKKIRVNFLPADGSIATPARKSLGPIADDEPSSFGSPASVMATPVGAVVKTESKPNGATHIGEAKQTATNPSTQAQQTPAAAIASAVSGAAAGTAAVASTSADELRAQLKEAQAQISRLTTQAAEQTGLRQRKVEGSEKAAPSTVTAQAVQTSPTGVPVPTVAALCLLSFLLAYLLF